MVPVQPAWLRTWLTCCCVVKTEFNPLLVQPAGIDPTASLSNVSESSTPGVPGVGIADGDGLGDGVTPGVGEGDGVGVGDGVTAGDGEGFEVGEGAGAGLGNGCPAIHAF